MSLKCQFCGKEYLYDMKICHSCEEKAITSGLNSQDRNDHKWRCDNFLGQSALPFGKIFEPVQRTYRWNCNTAMACVELLKSNLHTVETIIKETPHREKLEKNNYEWNIFSSIKFTNVQDTERKLNYLLKFE
jgi:hypothetical protein